ncbi:signal recognition [Lasallia pustulata]|uniref:Signal recognition particle subunit SRP68 n=1 Tax=Lasallia pustulata TaxID=136370 RepID=A0A1W5D7J0_9LECA|nr:signal recognition [Lasallia pustulata]
MDITNFVTAQREKALLIGDYASYRTSLSRRLLTVRKKLGRASQKGRKYAPKAPVTAEDIASNNEFIHLLLLASERAWAHAMHMKSTHSAESTSRGITGSTRRHIISRLHKGSAIASQLVELLEDRENTGARPETILEARAYYVSLVGAVKFEKQNWEECLKAYSESRLIYTVLAQSLLPQQHDPYRDLLSGTVDPSIRYAAYQLKLPRTLSINSIVARYVPRTRNEYVVEVLAIDPEALHKETAGAKKGMAGNVENIPKSITWRSRTVNIEDAAIAQALAAVSSAEQQLSSLISSNPELTTSGKASAYDEILIPSQDAVDATKTAIEELSSEGVAPGDHRMQALQITRTAVNYDLVAWRIGRNRVLCGRQDGAVFETEIARKPKRHKNDGKEWVVREESNGKKLARLRERVVLYDATLQSLDSVKELPGVAADGAFMTEIEAKRAYFAALRCLSIARSHAVLSKTKNALAIFSRALELASQVQSGLPTAHKSSQRPPSLDVSASQAETLCQLLQGLVSQHRALAELQNLALNTATAEKNKLTDGAPLIERLDEYPQNGADLTNLVSYPPKLEPVPVKPLFLDVAWNYIEYPGRVKEAVENGVSGTATEVKAAVEEKKEGRKGWFGFGR